MEEIDFQACAGLVAGRLAYPESLIAELPTVWGRLLREDALVSSVVEDRSRSGSGRIVAFGVSAFVTDAWVRAARLSREPYLTARTIRQALTADSPILRPHAIAREHAKGNLNVLILHYGEWRELPAEQRPSVRYGVAESFIATHRGYRIKEILQELWDELAPVFAHTPPRLSFSPAQRRLLRLALTGMTDADLSEHLGLALPTIKSAWRAIYERVAMSDPGVISEALLREAPVSRGSPAIRGREKRRRLLEYLHRHPEELRQSLKEP